MHLLVVGWDSADWGVLDPLLEAGELPVLGRLLRDGTRGRLRSTLPALTPPAWTTLATGVNPGRHGILNFWRRIPSTYCYEVVNSRHRRTRAFWDWLNQQQVTIGLLHYPITFPPEPVQGFCVSGWYVPPGQAFIYPTELQGLLEQEGPYRIQQLDGGVLTGSRSAYLRRLCEAAERQTQAALRLARARPVDVLWTVYLMTDWAQHFLWQEPAALRALYATMDRCLARLLEELAPKRVALLSDHGAGPVEGVLYANSLLEHLGFLTPGLGRRLDPEAEPAWRRHPVILALRRLKGGLVRRSGGPPDLSHQLDFACSRAYALGADGAIFVNLRGREPGGIVQAGEEYERIRRELADALLALRHPETGEPVIEAVHFREEIYHGPATDQAPDLLFVTREHRFSAHGGFGPHWFTSPGSRMADHRREGIWAIVAPECPAGAEGGTMDATDVVPTLLTLLQTPVPQGLDGRVHPAFFRPEWLAAHLPTEEPGEWDSRLAASPRLTREEEEAISRQLRDLGYLE